MTTSLLIIATGENAEDWRSELVRALPGTPIYVDGEDFDKAAITHALVWKPPVGYLASLPNLRAIFSMAAGVDHIFADTELPQGIPVVKLVHEATRQQHRDYVIHAIIHHHRDMMQFAVDQGNGVWKFLRPAINADRRIGILGLGPIGAFAAQAVAGLGFPVKAWRRSQTQLDGIACYSGAEGLKEVASTSDILVSMLPRTPETVGILNAELFAMMPKGAAIINVGRGNHLDEEALLAAIDSGHLSGATLDVLQNEPPPAGHPFFAHPRVRLTPHIASEPNPRVTAWAVSENLERMSRGLPPEPLAERDRGY